MPRGRFPVVLGLVCVTLVAGCSKTSAPVASSTTASAVPTAASASASASVSTAASASVAAASVPTTCSAIPVALIGPYVGGVATTRSFPAAAHSVSCEFANATASSILVLNIGAGATPASFASFRAISGLGGRTVASVSGIGSQAFSISRAGVPAGMGVLTSGGVLVAVTARLPFVKDEALIRQILSLYAGG